MNPIWHRPGWLLRQTRDPKADVDAGLITADRLLALSADAIAKLPLTIAHQTVELGDCFTVVTSPTPGCVLVEGDLARFHHLGKRQQGGRLEVLGAVGRYFGHAMRRGCVMARDAVGDFAGCHLIAGTVVSGGTFGEEPGFAARRGTFLCGKLSSVPANRWSEPTWQEYPFARIMRGVSSLGGVSNGGPDRWCDILLERIVSAGALVSRGDRAVGGQAEFVLPPE